MAAVGVLLFAGVTTRLFVWPDLAAVPATVDAIVELGELHDAGDRDSVALELARTGRARYLVQSTVQADDGTDRCLPPVPGVRVLCFHPDPDTTRGEARRIARLADQYGWHSIVLVTTPDLAWRAELRVGRCLAGDVYVATAPLPATAWPEAIPYQWAATVKALVVERDC